MARANLLAATKISGCKIYNVGGGVGRKMIDVAKTLQKVMKKKIKIVDRGERVGDPTVLIADISKIRKELKWSPKVTFEEGLQRTIEYYRRQL